MASVNFPPSLGGDNSTVTDDSNPTTGLANGGHRLRFVPALAQMVACMQYVMGQLASLLSSATTQANNAAASAQTAVNAPGTSGTSTTSIAVVQSGAISPSTQTGKAWVVGQWVNVARTSAPAAVNMTGVITAYNSGTGAMTINIVQAIGSGTFSDWTISLSAPLRAARPISAQATNFTAVANAFEYLITASCTMTLPATPAIGDEVAFAVGRSGITVTIGRNGVNIMQLAEDYIADIPYQRGVLRYMDATVGWQLG